MVTPVHHVAGAQPEEALDNPAVLMINALLDSGTWNPEAFGITKDMLSSHQPAWAFCQDYQDKTGAPPKVGHFARSFPSIEVLSGVNPEWAADKLRDHYYERELRRTLMGAITSINMGDHDGARQALLEIAKTPQAGALKGMSVFDPASVAEGVIKHGWNTHWGRLKAVTGGLGRGELWYLAARLGQGKSWLAACYAVAAAEQGARVAIASIEMPAVQYANRVHSLLARGDSELRRALRSEDPRLRAAALEALPPIPGAIEIFDPSHLRMNLVGMETLANQYDIIIPDHVGLLADATGKRSVEDWRVAAVISNTLKELTLRYNVSILGLAQVNREGETASDAPPKVSQLSQTDALGQDADVIVTLKRMGIRAIKHYIAKNRGGDEDTFYTHYRPGDAEFGEITADEARSIQSFDRDRAASA